MFKWACLASVMTLALGCGDESQSPSARTSESASPVQSEPSPPQTVIIIGPDEIRRIPLEDVKAYLDATGRHFLHDPWRGLPSLDLPGPNYDQWDVEQGNFDRFRH